MTFPVVSPPPPDSAAKSLSDRWLILLLVLELVATLVDIGWGPWSVVGFEEGRNARAALQLACGHGDRLLDLQYRDFCGGCTGVAVIGAPLFRLLGDSVATWKLVPAGFHLGLVASVGLAVRTAADNRAALLAMTVMAAAPPALRELSLTAWGNHAEVRTLVFGAVVLLLTRTRPVVTLLLAGLLAGLAVWFAHISTFALPALILLALRRGRMGVVAIPGFVAGLAPLAIYLLPRPTAQEGARSLWIRVGAASPASWASYLLGPLRAGVLWPATELPIWDAALSGTAILAVGGAAMGSVWALRHRLPHRGLALFMVTAAAGFGVAVFLRPDLWTDVPTNPGFSAFHIRYRAVLWPLVPAGLGLLCARSGRLAVLCALPLVLAGLGARGLAWQQGPGPTLWRSAWSEPGRPDATVPEGDPPRRNPWSLDRRTDIDAARAFLDDHTDPLPACSLDHAGELGRRIGLHLRRGHSPDASFLPPPGAATVAGVAWGLLAPAGRFPERQPGVLPEPWRSTVQQATDRLQPDPQRRPHTPGTCLGLADQALSRASEDGRLRVVVAPPAPPEGCSDPTAWQTALSSSLVELGACPAPADWPPCPALPP